MPNRTFEAFMSKCYNIVPQLCDHSFKSRARLAGAGILRPFHGHACLRGAY